MHVIVVSEVIPSVAPNALQASVCDEQLVTVGGEIALSRKKTREKNKITLKKEFFFKKKRKKKKVEWCRAVKSRAEQVT